MKSVSFYELAFFFASVFQWRLFSGSRKRAIRPPPSLANSSSDPSCKRAIRSTIASPSPVPVASVRAFSRRVQAFDLTFRNACTTVKTIAPRSAIGEGCLPRYDQPGHQQGQRQRSTTPAKPDPRKLFFIVLAGEHQPIVILATPINGETDPYS